MTPQEELLALRERAGFCLLPEHALIEISGADAAKYLQARLSSDVFALSVKQGQLSALLDRKAYIIAYLSLHRLAEDKFIMLLDRSQLETVMKQLETYHFQEKLEYRVLEKKLWTVQGGAASLVGPRLEEFGIEYLEANNDEFVIHRSLTGDTGFIYTFSDGSAAFVRDLEQAALALNMVPLSIEALELARVEAGLPQWKVDFDESTVLPETGLENVAASYSKGCYQGQEVLARIRTYGAPKRGLVGLVFEPPAKAGWTVDTKLVRDGIEIGTLKSNIFSPTFSKAIALAYVQREQRVPETRLEITIDGRPHVATVCALPFYSPERRRAQARTKYEAAITEFTVGSEAKAIEQLAEVVRLDPLFADAYEALGVALSRQERLEEAIAIMKQLERLNPESVMAHANLSVFYMQQGNKEAAEDEKAKAMSIRMAQIARDFSKEQQQEAERRKRKEDAEQRMSMFQQVLEIDADDFLANSGMGSAYVDLDRFAEAIPFLKKALAARPNHTVAYATLAQAYERLGQVEDAIEVYRQGVAMAAQKGEMAPMKDMQLQLERLGAKVSK